MIRKAWLYFTRAMRLCCPECGASPVFIPFYRLRTMRDWFTPLDGCPRCGYAYERETGYFLLSIWAVNYGAGSILGIAIYVLLETFLRLPLPELLFWVITPVILFNLLFARHAKSLFLAFDHFFDPHRKEGGDDGGSKVLSPDQPGPPTPQRSPDLVLK